MLKKSKDEMDILYLSQSEKLKRVFFILYHVVTR